MAGAHKWKLFYVRLFIELQHNGGHPFRKWIALNCIYTPTTTVRIENVRIISMWKIKPTTQRLCEAAARKKRNQQRLEFLLVPPLHSLSIDVRLCLCASDLFLLVHFAEQMRSRRSNILERSSWLMLVAAQNAFISFHKNKENWRLKKSSNFSKHIHIRASRINSLAIFCFIYSKTRSMRVCAAFDDRCEKFSLRQM